MTLLSQLKLYTKKGEAIVKAVSNHIDIYRNVVGGSVGSGGVYVAPPQPDNRKITLSESLK